MAAYYNEHEPFAAQWMRNLIAAGHIAPGDVDERDIQDVQPADLAGYEQCHFFAGIGGWSYALRLAGWPDDRSIWTGSCPCQPFSSAGKGEGFDDPRHLWPAWFRLVRERRPLIVAGEQVASPDGLAWFDTVATDLEDESYGVWAPDLPAACVEAVIKRQRLWFLAESASERIRRLAEQPRGDRQDRDHAHSLGDGEAGPLAGAAGKGRQRSGSEPQPDRRQTQESGRLRAPRVPVPWGDSRCGCWDRDAFHRTVGMLPGEVCTNAGVVGGTNSAGLAKSRPIAEGPDGWFTGRAPEPASAIARPWRDAEWIYCTDDKYRAVEPGTFPLAHGVPARMGRLRAYGNAIVPQVAAEFIQTYMRAVA